MGVYVISESTNVEAPIDRCFLLSTSIDLAARSVNMRPVSGKTTGLIEAGDQLIWFGWKFGLPQIHESLVTAYERPTYFQDTMGRGRFQRFQHDHSFSELAGHTVLQDKVRFSLPMGFLGDLVAKHIMVPYLARTLRRRFSLLKRVAEGDEWRHYLPDDAQ